MTHSIGRVGICTLGCKVNQYESEAIAERLCENGAEICDFSESCDAYLVNTCTVTAEGDRKSRQMIRRTVANNPDAFVAVIGCFSQLKPETAAAIPGVAYVGGTRDKLAAADSITDFLKTRKKPPLCIISIAPTDGGFESMSVSHSERTRAYVKIEDGCACRCSYCIIPQARGAVCSKPIDDVVREVNGLAEAGYREVVLTGIETSAYEYGLISLLRELDKTEGLSRIRISSFDPASLTPDFVSEFLKLERTVPHFHLSLQNGSDRILRLMRRRYNTDMVLRYTDFARSLCPDITFTSDIIVGFPTETEEDFNTGCEFYERLGLLDAHIFPYSKRSGTEAAAMNGQLTHSLKSARAAKLAGRLEQLSQTVRTGFVGREYPVLFEEYAAGLSKGHTPNFLHVAVPREVPHGEIRAVRITSVTCNNILGELI